MVITKPDIGYANVRSLNRVFRHLFLSSKFKEG
jgi:hypothetical protein